MLQFQEYEFSREARKSNWIQQSRKRSMQDWSTTDFNYFRRQIMKTKLFSALLLVAFIPGTALAERPTVTSVKQQLVLVMGMVQDLTEQLDRTRTELSITRAELAQVKGNTVLGLDGLLQLTQDSNGLDTAVFRGVNLQVVNGNGVTDSRNGLGNIVIGYNNSSEVFIDRFGSHNIILGDEQAYPNTQEVITEKILSNRDLAVIVANDMDMLIGANQATTIGKNSRSLLALIGMSQLAQTRLRASVERRT
jgi:hypothetical protein